MVCIFRISVYDGVTNSDIKFTHGKEKVSKLWNDRMDDQIFFNIQSSITIIEDKIRQDNILLYCLMYICISIIHFGKFSYLLITGVIIVAIP